MPVHFMMNPLLFQLYGDKSLFISQSVSYGTGTTAISSRGKMRENRLNKDHSYQKDKMFLIINNLQNLSSTKIRMVIT
jgi:hypothetical protein